ncbi:MAG: class I SAM-dependent methyltransferase [Chloroflexaceae bacterium]|nr:class I SAM-dependent methyltransferase [Chloroflexaceae bacterium]
MIEIRHTEEMRMSYDTIYSRDAMPQHWDTFFEWIIELLEPQTGRRLLDVCCGEGQSLRVAPRYGLQAVGVDFSQVAIREAAHNGAGVAWVGDAQRLPCADASFDYVINLGSLEHLEDMAQGVREMARVLKPDGRCCIMVPNTFGYFWTIWYAGLTGEVF